MKITKQRLLEIIKEETAAITEDDKVSKKIAHLMDKEGKPQKQAVAMALNMVKEDWEGAEDDKMIDAVMRGEEDGATGEKTQRDQVDPQWTDHYDAAYERALEKNTVVLKDPPDIKRMKQGLKRISRPRSAGDFRSDKERFENP
jgi:predicted  nucleic acid-binding Zn-ribbon protein